MAIFIGIDLAGSEKRDTGLCIIKGGKISISIVHTDAELLRRISAEKGRKIIGIDAPLSLPKGRRSIETINRCHFRRCDLELRKLGIRFFPITLGPMRMLTKRGMALKRKILRIEPKCIVFEVYPGATYDLLGIPRKDKKLILAWARRILPIKIRPYSQDELDSVAAALTVRIFAEGNGTALGSKKEGQIVVPRPPESR